MQDTLDIWISQFNKLNDLGTIERLEGKFITGRDILRSRYLKIKTGNEDKQRLNKVVAKITAKEDKKISYAHTITPTIITTMTDDSYDTLVEEEETVVK